MNKSKRQIIYERAFLFAEKHYKKIVVRMGDYSGGQACQHVSRQAVEVGEAEKVAVTLSFVPNSGVNVHFINKVKDVDGDYYIDNTLGYLSKKNIYFLIDEFGLDELEDKHMSKMLVEYKEKILNLLFSSAELKKLQIEDKDI